MNEALTGFNRLIKETKRTCRSITTKLTNILPLVRELDSAQEKLTQLRRALRVQFKKPAEPKKQPDQKLNLFMTVAQALEPAMVKKQALVAKLEERGVRVPCSFSLLLSMWRKEGLFNTSFGKGWYCLSAKGRNIAGLPPKSSPLQESVQPERSLGGLGAEKEESPQSDEAGQKRSLNQLDVVVLGLHNAKPRRLNKKEIKLLLDAGGKTSTPGSLTFLLTPTGSKRMIESSGKKGNKDYGLTGRGEIRVEQLCALNAPAEDIVGWYALTQEQLTDQHYSVLERVFPRYDADNPGHQKLYKAQDNNGNFVWVWWGISDEFVIPEQPLLGHLLKHEAFPESLELPSKECFFRVDGEDVLFNPSERADDRIIDFVKRNSRLPDQILV